MKIPTNLPLLSGEKVDAIVVLTGGYARTKCAIDLLEKKYAKTLFISGVNKGVELKDLSIYMNNESLFYQSTTLGYQAHDTKSNAYEIKQFLDKHEFKSIILVTSDYHIPRSIIFLRHTNAEVKIIPYPVFPQKGRGYKWLIRASREYNAILYFILSGTLKCSAI